MNPKVGDYVHLSNFFSDVWHEVREFWDDSQFFVVWHEPTSETQPDNKAIVYKELVTKIHEVDQPWNKNECRIVYTRDGVYGLTKNGPIRPLPAEFTGEVK